MSNLKSLDEVISYIKKKVMRNEVYLYIPDKKEIRSIMSFLKKFWKKIIYYLKI